MKKFSSIPHSIISLLWFAQCGFIFISLLQLWGLIIWKDNLGKKENLFSPTLIMDELPSRHPLRAVNIEDPLVSQWTVQSSWILQVKFVKATTPFRKWILYVIKFASQNINSYIYYLLNVKNKDEHILFIMTYFINLIKKKR